MTAGSIVVPAIVPLRTPIPGKTKSSIDTNTKIELSTDQRDVEIFYTINGKKPDPFPKVGSERYTMQYFAPFTLPAGKQTVKAMAVSKDGIRESNIGTKIFEVGYVPSKEMAPVDDDLEFQEELEKQNSTLNVKRATKNLLLSDKTAWTDIGTMKQTIQKMADMNVSGSSYRKPTTGTRFLNNRKSVQDKNDYNRSHQDSYGRSSRHHDREISDASTQAMRLTREAELLKSYSETQSDPFSRYYISRGNTGQQEARPIPPKPGKMGACVYCKSVVPFNTTSCVVCEGPIPVQYHQPNVEIRSSIKEIEMDRNGHYSGVEMYRFLKYLMGKFIKPTKLTCELEELQKIEYLDSTSQLNDNQLIIGLTTKSKLNVLLKDGDVTVYQERTFYRAVRKNGDVTVYQERTFYRAVREFYQTAVKYALDHLPLDDEVIQNLQFVDVTRKLEFNINQVLYFCQRFGHILKITNPEDLVSLQEEFVDYQTLPDREIRDDVWKEGSIKDGSTCTIYFRPDILWAFLSTMKCSITDQLRFKHSSRVAILVLTVPHSNADEERVFSFIKQSKTDFRDSLDLDNALTSLLTIKMTIPEPCHKYEPPEKVIKKSKMATSNYNKEHINK